jgi:hypothetical protein
LGGFLKATIALWPKRIQQSYCSTRCSCPLMTVSRWRPSCWKASRVLRIPNGLLLGCGA